MYLVTFRREALQCINLRVDASDIRDAEIEARALLIDYMIPWSIETASDNPSDWIVYVDKEPRENER